MNFLETFCTTKGKLEAEANFVIDPLGQPKVTASSWIIVFAHVVRPSPLFKSRKTKQQKTTFATGVTMALAELIIDDTCLVIVLYLHYCRSRAKNWKFTQSNILFQASFYCNAFRCNFQTEETKRHHSKF